MSRMFSSPQKDDADDESSGAAAARRHSSAYNIPVLVDSGSGMSVYEIEAGENGVSEVGDNTPLKYRLSVPSGFKQLSDPKARHATGTFVYGESNPTFLARRCELASVDKAIAVLRLKTGPIDKEMSNLESRRAKLITQIEAIPKLQDRFEFYIGISQPTSVELLPLKDEELQELSRLGEAEAQEKLSQGKGYDVLVTKQHHRASTGDKAKSASQARGGRGEEEDQAEWQGWEMVCCNPGEVEEGGAGARLLLPSFAISVAQPDGSVRRRQGGEAVCGRSAATAQVHSRYWILPAYARARRCPVLTSRTQMRVFTTRTSLSQSPGFRYSESALGVRGASNTWVVEERGREGVGRES
eukprot:533053-Rhodomonas_salina.1